MTIPLRLATAFLLSGAIFQAASLAAADVVGAGANWLHHAGDGHETGFSRLHQITTANIGKLGLAWSLDLPGEVTLEATPLAVNGVLYFTGSYAAVYAVDAVTGRLLWKFDPQTWKHNPLKMNFAFGANRGAAYANGRVFSAALDGRLFALDAKTGKTLWSVETTDPKSMQTITGPPLTFKDKVIVGNAGADFGARGYVTAYDATTGHQVWRFYTVPGSPEENRGDPAMERAAATWGGEFWKTGTGGAVWDSMTFDPEFNRVYLGTGNAGPYDPAVRSPGGGDNLYTASIVALDADTGKYAWHYQINPTDAWDFDCTQPMVLATLTIEGKSRKVLMQAPKNGFFYVIDRLTGKLISAEKIGKVTWADRIDVVSGRPVETAGDRYQTGRASVWPSSLGAHSWQAMSYNPSTHLVYLPYQQVGSRISKGVQPEAGDISIGGLNLGWAKADPLDGTGALLAWDPVHQRQAWKVQLGALWNGGALSTAGGLVFQGTADGYFSGYDASQGRRLWHFNAGLGIIAAPISYSVGARQYISVLVGYGGQAAIASELAHVGWKYGVQPRRLLTFALGGKAALPPTPPPSMAVKALDDPSLDFNPVDVATGHAIYLACAACHGRDLIATGAPAPDLRESAVALNPDSFWTVVHDGALIQRGMPRFDGFTREQLMQIYAYIRSGARQALAAQRPGDKRASGNQSKP
jgi:quinohemoprotein ethanol dehydrogenase